jgi:hypothetical protein
MKIRYFYLKLCLAFLISTPLLADEVWNSTYGKVTYEADIGTTALWSYDYHGATNFIYINNLAKVYEGRGAYQGYWVQENSEVKCKRPRLMKDKESFYWGRFDIQFLDPNFPSRWQAKWSYCNQKPTQLWSGTPITN